MVGLVGIRGYSNLKFTKVTLLGSVTIPCHMVDTPMKIPSFDCLDVWFAVNRRRLLPCLVPLLGLWVERWLLVVTAIGVAS